jgi:hypothetical protein
MFLQSTLEPELHSALTIALTLPSGRAATLDARVVHVLDCPTARLRGIPPGFGVKFERLERDKLDFLHELVAWARETQQAEHAEYLERAQWLQAAEATGVGLSMRPPPPSSPSDAMPEAPQLRPPSLPDESALRRDNAEAFDTPSREAPTARMRGVRANVAAVRGRADPSQPATAPSTARPAASRPPSVAPARSASSAPPALPNTARLRGSRPPSVRPARGPSEAPLGAAGQLLTQAEATYAAGQAIEASRHVKLLSAMTFEDPEIQARVAELKLKVLRAAAVDFEKQATQDEKHQRWTAAAQGWLRVAEGRPQDSAPLLRAALAQLQAGIEPRGILEIAKRAVELAPSDPQTHLTLAQVYNAADMQASARHEQDEADRCSPARAPSSTKPPSFLQRLLGRDTTK